MTHSASIPPRALGVPTLEDLGPLEGRSVLVRGDLDIRNDDAESVAHSRRLSVLLPTLKWLTERGAQVTVCGHHGDLGAIPDKASFDRIRQAVEDACPGVTVLPNLAGDPEFSGDRELAARLVKGHDFYVNEAFQWCWLPLASIEGPPELLPSAAGLRLAHDVELLEPFLH